MISGNRRINFDINVRILNNQIAGISKTKFLGILIDEILTWNDQINNVNTHLSRISGAMYRASHVLGTTGFLTLCYSLFRNRLLKISHVSAKIIGHCIKCKTSRYSRSFVPVAIRMLNAK